MLLATVLACGASLAVVLDEPTIFSGQIENAASVVFSPDGHWLATGGVDGKVALWAADSCDGTVELGAHDGEVHALAFTPDGALLASGDEYEKLSLWRVGPGVTDAGDPKRHQVASKSSSGAVEALAFSRDGKTLFVGSRDNALLVFAVADLLDSKDAGAEPRSLAHDYAVVEIAVAGDGKTLASGDDGGNVRLWTLTGEDAPRELRSWKHEARVTALAFAADDATLFVATAEPALRAIDVATGKARDGFAAKGGMQVEANALVVAPGGRELIAGTQDNLVLRIDAARGTVTKKLEGHEGPVTSVAVLPDGRVIASASLDRKVRVWTNEP